MSGGARLRAIVRGRVQGVGFRWFVEREARGLGLYGWVRNCPDGSVEVVAEGPADLLDRLAVALAIGPAGADVTGVEAHREPATGAFASFSIAPGG